MRPSCQGSAAARLGPARVRGAERGAERPEECGEDDQPAAERALVGPPGLGNARGGGRIANGKAAANTGGDGGGGKEIDK